MSRKRKPIGRWLNNNKFVFALSVFLAVVIWVVVALQFSERKEATFSDIPVTFDTTMPEKLHLQMFGQTDLSVTVTVTGKRYEISSAVLSQDDFIVTASTANVTATGRYTLPISVRVKDPSKDVEIVSFSPESIDIFFDYNLTMNYPVQVQVAAPDDQVAADGYIYDEPVASKAEVTLSGAATELNKIDRVVAKVTLTEPLEKTKTVDTVLSIVNENGGIVRSTYVLAEDGMTNVTVTLPILKVMQIKPTVRFTNFPSYFSDNPISYICSPSGTVEAAILTDLLETPNVLDMLSLGNIDFSQIKTGMNTFEFDASKISNIRILDDIDSFRIFFSIDGFQSRKFVVPAEAVSFNKVPDGTTVAAVEGAEIEVTVIGFAQELDTLTADNIRAVVDVSVLEEDADATQLPVTMSVINTTSCWVSGSYTVPITVRTR